MTTIAPIETSYAGCKFRSRLEARWAVFFNHAGIKWEYEPQGYVVDGTPYLPDFLLYPGTEHQTWFEVKGQFPTEEEIAKAAGLATGTGIRTYLYFAPVEVPGVGLTKRVAAWNDFFEEYSPVPYWHNEFGWILNGSEMFRWEAGLKPTAFRFNGSPGYPERMKSGLWWWTDCPVCGHVILKMHGVVGWCPTIPDSDGDKVPAAAEGGPLMAHETPRLIAAYRAARSARFEHGENG